MITNEKTKRMLHARRSLFAHLSYKKRRLFLVIRERKNKTKERIRSGSINFPFRKCIVSNHQFNKDPIPLDEGTVRPSVAHNGITSVKGNRKRNHLNFVIFYPIFEKILTYFCELKRSFLLFNFEERR